MNALYNWLVESNRKLVARRKTHGYLTIQRACDREGLVIQADEPSPIEIEAILAAQSELERLANGETLANAMQILEPHTDGVFLVCPYASA